MTTVEKRMEQKLRRALYKAGYQLHKSRARRIHIDNLGGYMIVNYYINGVVAGSRYDLELDDVASFVKMYCD